VKAGAGFTLLEVCVALVIAAAGTLELYQAGFTGAAATAAASREQEATVRAQSRLAAIGTLTPLAAGDWSGDDGGGFAWRLEISREASDGGFTLYRVRVSEIFGRRLVTLETQRVGAAP